jgi:hypothetical protein
VKNFFKQVIFYFKSNFTNQDYRDLRRTWVGRAINTISFMMVILTLALWVTLFTILRDDLSVSAFPSATITAISCFAFFGGLLLAIVVGGWIGNALRRVFWKILVSLGK